jgi:signal transduction histidine kinase
MTFLLAVVLDQGRSRSVAPGRFFDRSQDTRAEAARLRLSPSLVENDGQGFDAEAVQEATPSWGVGLRPMRERAEMLGGSLRVDPEPGVDPKVEMRVQVDGRP